MFLRAQEAASFLPLAEAASFHLLLEATTFHLSVEVDSLLPLAESALFHLSVKVASLLPLGMLAQNHLLPLQVSRVHKLYSPVLSPPVLSLARRASPELPALPQPPCQPMLSV